MKFHLAINLDRMHRDQDMRAARDHVLDMVRMAEQGHFDVAWAAEHHALEMTIAPNPFQILTWWAQHTSRIRLGTAVVAAPYWHPIRLAGEAAFTDLISSGRLEFGIGSGAYQREFDRMFPGVCQSDGWRYLQEMLPAVRALWQGDYEHRGTFWSFPPSTSVPKPLQSPGPSVWIAARAPITFDYAVQNQCNIMSWPLTRPFTEAQEYRRRLDSAMAAHSPCQRPVFAVMRHCAVYEDERDWKIPIQSIRRVLGQFENLFKNLGDVVEGFPKEVPLNDLANRSEYDADMLQENLMFGLPQEVIRKLKMYEQIGVDAFIYYANTGVDHARQRRSLELFCEHVVPAFSDQDQCPDAV